MHRFAVVFLMVMLAAACGKNEEPVFLEDAQKTATDTATHPGSPGGAALVPDVSAGVTVLVTLEDNRIVVTDADRIPPGPAVFTVTNTGKEVHNLYVEGPGTQRGPAGGSIAQGVTTSFEVDLRPATWTLFCPIAGHRERGEELKLIIKPAAAPPPTSTVVPSTPTTTS